MNIYDRVARITLYPAALLEFPLYYLNTLGLKFQASCLWNGSSLKTPSKCMRKNVLTFQVIVLLLVFFCVVCFLFENFNRKWNTFIEWESCFFSSCTKMKYSLSAGVSPTQEQNRNREPSFKSSLKFAKFFVFFFLIGGRRDRFMNSDKNSGCQYELNKNNN